MKKKYLLFDLDGTLTDPKEGITKCFQYALESVGIEESDPDKLTWIIGPPLVDSFMKGYGFSQEKAEELTMKYRERYRPIGWKENVPYEGIVEALKRLHEAGFVIALATSKPEETSIQILELFGMAPYFDFIGGASFDLSRVRKAEVIAYVLNNLGIAYEEGKPLEEEVWMIGDTCYDVEGAAKFGIPCLGVLYGYGKKEDLEAAGAAAIVETVNEVAEFFLREYNIR